MNFFGGGDLWYLIISFAIKNSFTSFFPTLRPLIAFFCLIALAYIFDKMVTIVWQCEASLSFLILVPDIGGKAFRYSSLSKMLCSVEKYILYMYHTYIIYIYNIYIIYAT